MVGLNMVRTWEENRSWLTIYFKFESAAVDVNKCFKQTKLTLSSHSVKAVLLILDGRSEHVAQVGRK